MLPILNNHIPKAFYKIRNRIFIGNPGSAESKAGMVRIRLALESGQILTVDFLSQFIGENGENLIGRSIAQQGDSGFRKDFLDRLHAPDTFLSQFYVKIIFEQFFKLNADHLSFCHNSSPLFHVKAEMIFKFLPDKDQGVSKHGS